MDALIRDDDRHMSIGMVRKRLLVLLCAAFLVLVSLPIATSNATPETTNGFTPGQTYLAPNIWGWGIIGNPGRFEPFLVWANVSANPDGTDIKNVTLKIDGPNAAIRDSMNYNSTSNLYERLADPLPNDGVFRVVVVAYDVENRSRTSYDRTITAEANPEPSIDPSITFPYVVGGSLGLAGAVFFLAHLYDKRCAPLEASR